MRRRQAGLKALSLVARGKNLPKRDEHANLSVTEIKNAAQASDA